ncbi:MAG: hypothetical protein ABIJ56_15525, partial [Pseudomonadota bacterium]
LFAGLWSPLNVLIILETYDNTISINTIRKLYLYEIGGTLKIMCIIFRAKKPPLPMEYFR